MGSRAAYAYACARSWFPLASPEMSVIGTQVSYRWWREAEGAPATLGAEQPAVEAMRVEMPEADAAVSLEVYITHRDVCET